MKHLVCLPAIAGLLCSAALAGDVHHSPSGFNLETVPAAGPIVAVLDDGSRLLSTGSFGAASLTRRAPDGTLSLFAEGFASIDGVSQSTLSGDVAVGEYGATPPVWLLRDLNGDGDALDAGEKSPWATPLPTLANGLVPQPFDLAYAPDSDDLFLIGATDFSAPPSLPAILRCSDGSASVYFTDLGYSGHLAFRDGVLYAADLDSSTFISRVVALADGDADGDAMDPGESWVYAGGLSGASGLAFSADGSLWFSAGFSSVTFTSCVGRLGPDGDGDGAADFVEECVVDGFGYSTGLHLFEGPGGFSPGAAGEGELYMGDFGFDGEVVLRSAPLAATAVDGYVGPNSLVHVTVSGAPFAAGLFAISLDTQGVTVPGLGDLGLGFNDLHALSPMLSLGADGEAVFKLVFRELPALLGHPLTIQGITLEGGAYGLGNALDFTFGS